MKKFKENEKGITFIVLAVTIIILIILAGVSVAMLTGGKGIINQTIFAKEKTNFEIARKEVEFEVVASFDNNGDYIVNEAIDNLKNNLKIPSEDIKNSNGTLFVKNKGYDFIINKCGKMLEQGIVEAAVIASDPTSYYGKIVSNYECANSEGVNAWKIFYADENYIYLITDDYVSYQYVPDGKNGSKIKVNSTDYKLSFNNIIADYKGAADILADEKTSYLLEWVNTENSLSASGGNVKSTAYMLDSNAWKGFKGDKAEYAIGGPTIDLFKKSYNNMNFSTKMIYEIKSDGYLIGMEGGNVATETWPFYDMEGGLYLMPSTEKASAMWLAGLTSSSGNWMFYVERQKISREGYYTSHVGFRPIVCLKSNVQLQLLENGMYAIK